MSRTRQRVVALALMVVEGVVPGRLAVAVGALLAEIAHMLVVFEMARYALCLRGMKQCVRGMTVAKREARQIVVETLFDEPDHIGVPPLVIRMTRRAFVVADLGRERVEACLRRQILGNLLVAVEA